MLNRILRAMSDKTKKKVALVFDILVLCTLLFIIIFASTYFSLNPMVGVEQPLLMVIVIITGIVIPVIVAFVFYLLALIFEVKTVADVAKEFQENRDRGFWSDEDWKKNSDKLRKNVIERRKVELELALEEEKQKLQMAKTLEDFAKKANAKTKKEVESV